MTSVKNNIEEDSKGGESFATVYRHTNYVRRLVVVTIAVTLMLVFFFAFIWWFADIVLDCTVFLYIKKVAVVDVQESKLRTYDPLLEEISNDEKLPKELREKCNTLLHQSTSTIAVADDDFVGFVRMVVRCIVYFCAVVICGIFGLYMRNNPDTMIAFMGTRSKKQMCANIVEDLRRERIAAKMHRRRKKKQDVYKEEVRDWRLNVQKKEKELQLRNKELKLKSRETGQKGKSA